MRDEIGTGDPVEVLVAFLPESRLVVPAEQDAEPIPVGQRWVPATVSYVTETDIGVVFSDSVRLAVPRHADTWRPA